MVEFYLMVFVIGILAVLILVCIGVLALSKDGDTKVVVSFAVLFLGLGLVGSVAAAIDAAKRADRSLENRKITL